MATPKFHTRNRQGVHFATTNADVTQIALFDTVPSTAYQLDVKVTGFTTSGAAAPAAYAYWRRALYVTNGDGVVTQVGANQTPAADLESDAGATLGLAVVGTQVVLTISAAFPTNWVLDAYIGVADDVNMS